MKKNLMDQLKYNQSMEKTNEAIHRLSTINENQHSNLMQLNIQRFYYSISEETLNKDFTILSQGKKEHESSFDVRRTSYDGAELCGLIGIYIQSFLESILENDQMGLQQDYGLIIVLTEVNFLTETFNLERNTYRPYITKRYIYYLYMLLYTLLEYYFFRNSEFHATSTTIFTGMNYNGQICYNIMVSHSK